MNSNMAELVSATPVVTSEFGNAWVCGAQCWVNCLNLVFDNALDLTPFFLGGLGITLPPLWVCHISS